MPLSIDSSASASSVQPTAPQFGHEVKLLNANDILAYVTLALSNMGSQLNDYKEVVMKQQADAKEIREALVLARQLNANGGDFTTKDMPAQGQNYNEMMTKLSHHLDEPNVKTAYVSMLSSFGPYADTTTHAQVGKGVASDSDTIDAKVGSFLGSASIHDLATQIEKPLAPVAGAIDSTIADSAKKMVVSGASVDVAGTSVDVSKQDGVMNKEEMDGFVNSLNDALTGINSGNELLMMNLQNAMQNRNEITQFASNVMKTLHDTSSTPINNLKGLGDAMLDLPRSIAPAERDALFNRGVDHYEQGAVEDALEIFRFIAFLAPDDGGVWRALAACHETLGQEHAASQLRELAQQVEETLS